MGHIETTISIKKSTYFYLQIYVESYGISLGQVIDLYISMIDSPMTIELMKKAKTMGLELNMCEDCEGRWQEEIE